MSKLPDPLSSHIRVWFPQAEVHLSVGEMIEALGKAGYQVFPANRVETIDAWVENSILEEELRPEAKEAHAEYVAAALAHHLVDGVKDCIVYAAWPQSKLEEQRMVRRYTARAAFVCATKEELEAEGRERVRHEAAQQRNARREGF